LIAIRGLSILTSNPAIGGGGNVKLQEASKLLNFLGELLERGDDAHGELTEFAESIKAMADAGRAPTPSEWQALADRSQAAHDIIQDARRRAEAEEAAEEEPTPEPTPEPEPEPTPEPEPDPNAQ
jgi:outer membrane biosynthesis protein TonB